MEVDLANLSEDDAQVVTVELLAQLEEVRRTVERAQRREAGIRKMIDGLVEMFPAVEDLLPEDLDNDEAPRPRGAEAVRQVLAEKQGNWLAVSNVVAALDRYDWLPNSSNPANAVRTALERLVEAKIIEKGRSTDGAVIYRLPPAYEFGEEPF